MRPERLTAAPLNRGVELVVLWFVSCRPMTDSAEMTEVLTGRCYRRR